MNFKPNGLPPAILFRKHLVIRRIGLLGSLLLFVLAACQPETVAPTVASAAPTVDLTPFVSENETREVPPTWTAVPPLPSSTPAPMNTAGPTRTPLPPATLFPTLRPTLTAVPSPTTTPENIPSAETFTPIPLPTEVVSPVEPVFGPNLLLNSSFEEGHYNMNGIPELQLPVGWVLEWDEGPTGFGTEVWDVYQRPETRVLPENFLPAAEHPLYIYDGMHTVKIFKGDGAISFKLFQDIYLEPGTYELEINTYPDLYMDYQNGVKIWADDPLTGQFRFIAPGATGWMPTTYGRKNTFRHTFLVEEGQEVRVGAAMRGNHAIMNDGWFMDDWSLKRIQN